MPRLLLFLLGTMLIGQPAFAQSSVPLTVATYNLRYNNKGDGINAWPNRKENVKALIASFTNSTCSVRRKVYGIS